MRYVNHTPISLAFRPYGRNIQQLATRIAQLPDKEQGQHQLQQLTKLMQEMRGIEPDALAYFLGIFEKIAEDPSQADFLPCCHGANLEPMVYKKHQLRYKCCGFYLTTLLKSLGSKLASDPNPQKYVVPMVKLIQRVHKKSDNVKEVLEHIEQISGEKLPFSEQELAYLLPRSNYEPTKKNGFRPRKNAYKRPVKDLAMTSESNKLSPSPGQHNPPAALM